MEELRKVLEDCLLQGVRNCDLHMAIYKALDEKFVVVNVENKVKDLLDIFNEWIGLRNQD